MHYRADMFTSGGRVQIYGDSLESIRDTIRHASTFVWAWQIVDLATHKTVDYRTPNGGA